MKHYILLIVVALSTFNLVAQELPQRGLVRRGNREYNNNDYKASIESYDKAYQLAPTEFEVLYNYANALHKDEQYERAEELYGTAVIADSLLTAQDRADLHYNMGNSRFMQQKYQEALENYKESMRANPDDVEAKYNYALTKKLLEEQEQNQDQSGGGGDGEGNDDNSDQNQEGDQDQEGDQNQDQNQDGDQNQDQDQGQDEKEQNQEPQPSEGRISPQEQQQMLDAIQAQEDKTQDKLKEEGKGVIIKGRKNW